MQKITENIYVESKRSVCNSSCVVTKDGVVVIDTPLVPANAKKMAAEISKLGKIRYVINTEPHGDHISGSCYFGGTLITHEGTRDAILDYKVEDIKDMLKIEAPGVVLDDDFRYRPSDITFSQRLTFYLGDHSFHLINMPGHTPYQVVVYVPEERIIFTSDNIVRNLPYLHQAIPDKWFRTLKQMQKFDVDYVVPGHGEVGDKSCISEMYDILTIWVETVEKAIAQGMTRQEAQQKLTMFKQFPNLPRDKHTAEVIAMNVGRLYDVLKK